MTQRPLGPPRRRAHAWRWPVVITGLLIANVSLMGLLIFSSIKDRSASTTEPRYYQRALEWDRIAAQRMASARLGWIARIEITQPTGIATEPLVSCRLEDADGVPIDDAVVVIEAFHLARAHQRINASLEHVGAGVYAAQLPAGRPGHWEFRVTVKRGQTIFTEICRVVVDPAESVSGG